MRFLEKNDENGLPIFEGDHLVLTIKDKFWGASYFGKFCEFYDIDTVTIDTLTNENYLEAKYEMRFFKDDVQIVTNKEEAYWGYIDKCKEKNIEPEKTLDDMTDVKNPDELYVSRSSDSLFFSYIVRKGVKKTSGYEGEGVIVSNEDLFVESKLDFPLKLKDSIIVELNEEWKTKFQDSLKNLNLEENDFTHVKFKVERIDGQFNYKINAFPTNNKGFCQVFSKDLNKAGMDERYRIEREIRKYNEECEDTDKSQISDKEARKKMDAVYDDKQYLIFEDYRFFLGIQNEINVVNRLFKDGLKFEKL